MPTALTVTSPFQGRQIGDRIEDPAEIESILSGAHAQHVVRSEAPEPPAARISKPSNQE